MRNECGIFVMWWNRPEEYNSSGKLESTHPSRTSVKSDQVFFGVESVMRVNADSLLIRAAATSTSGTLNDLTTDLIMANNNNRRNINVCNSDAFSVVSIMYRCHLKFYVVCINGRIYVSCSECCVVSNEPISCLVQPIDAHGGEVMYFGCFVLWVSLVFWSVMTSACVL